MQASSEVSLTLAPSLYKLPMIPLEDFDLTRCTRLSSDELRTVFRVMSEFSDGTLTQLGMDFKVWDWTKPEMYGLLLGMFVKNGLVPNSAVLCGLLDFIIDVADGYFDNPYHSFLHAMDVTYMVYWALVDLALAEELAFSTIDYVALIIAALTHDVLHPGVNNLFHVNAKTDLAKHYQNKSVLERQSCDHLSLLLRKHTFLTELNYGDLVSNVREPAKLVESIAIEAILNTDMCHHFGLLEKLSCTTEEVIGTPAASEESLHSDEESDEDMSDERTDAPSPLVPHDTNDESSIPDAARSRHGSCLHGHHQNDPIEHITQTLDSVALDHNHHRQYEKDPDNPPWQQPQQHQQQEQHHHHHHQKPLGLPTPPPFPRTMTPVHFSLPLADTIVESPEQMHLAHPGASKHFPSQPSLLESESALSDSTTSLPDIPGGPRRTSLPLSKHQRQQMINVILHAADISNAARPPDICKRWADMVVEEFFFQGEKEKELNLPISPNMDRESTNSVQIAFDFNAYVARPYFEILSELLPSTRPFIDNLVSNRARWESMGASVRPTVIAETPDAGGASGDKAGGDAQTGTGDNSTEDVSGDLLDPSNPGNGDPASAGGASGATPRGRRLSLAAGTIEIPQAFDIYVMNAARRYRNRYKTSRSLSSGRSRGMPLPGLSSSMWTVRSLVDEGGSPASSSIGSSDMDINSRLGGSVLMGSGGLGSNGSNNDPTSATASGNNSLQQLHYPGHNAHASSHSNAYYGHSIFNALQQHNGTYSIDELSSNHSGTSTPGEPQPTPGQPGPGGGDHVSALSLSLFGSRRWFPQRRCMSMDAQSTDHGGVMFHRWTTQGGGPSASTGVQVGQTLQMQMPMPLPASLSTVPPSPMDPTGTATAGGVGGVGGTGTAAGMSGVEDEIERPKTVKEGHAPTVV
ncbi:hypothetical protein HKX48_005906 [Thoreauomyces humboldtii]|nr:hypothetical protein HKX48_005906 [Thoreauomyces humboldtii]